MQVIKREIIEQAFETTYLIKQEIAISNIVIQEDEVSNVKWATYEEITELVKNNEFVTNRWENIKDILKVI